ncbi:MAG: hypothetical protein RJB26_84 [Pseudomonadota bacterium]|jgi:hypothetical protein
MSQEQPKSSQAAATPAVAGRGIAVQPLTEWLAVMTEEVQRKEEAARAAAAETQRRA